MATLNERERLIRNFPNLAKEQFEIICPASSMYNCIAYAVGDTSQYWSDEIENYWPPSVERDNTIGGLEKLFTRLEFRKCKLRFNLERGYQKVVLYGSKGQWTHAALQMPNGHWRSKLGKYGPLIEHETPGGVAGPATIYRRGDYYPLGVYGANRSSSADRAESYGRPYVCMKRRLQG